MASEPIECQVLVLRVSIHCEGCKKKVKKVLQTVHGVLRCDIDARSNKVVVTASTKLDPNVLVAKLRKSGKQAEPWPMSPAVAAAESQSQQETDDKNGNDEPTSNKPGPDNAEASAAEPSSNPQPTSPDELDAGEAPKPAPERKAEPSSNTGADEAATGAVAPRQPDEAKRQAEERQPVDARVTVEYDDRGGGDDGYAIMNRVVPAPQHVLSYNMARPSPSASYYAAPPAPAAPMAARPGPSQQGYIDEHYTPSYHGRSSSPYYYPPQQSSPYQQPASTEDYNYNYDYYYSAPPQRSAFSPPRDGYGGMFDDENANSCAVM